MAGLQMLLLWAGIMSLAVHDSATQMPPPPSCSYTVTSIKFGLQIDITSSTVGDYNINLNEEGRPETRRIFKHVASNLRSSYDITSLKPCTVYEHTVAFIDTTGEETPCRREETKTQTTKMTEDDIEVKHISGHVCYPSGWDISSSLSTSNEITVHNQTFCVKPGFNEICSNLITTFKSCGNSFFSLTESISLDFLKPGEINQTYPKELPAKIETTLPPNCKDFTVDYTCLEDGHDEPKNEQELEPFTDYRCTGQIKDKNDVTIKNTKAINVRIDCSLQITITSSSTNTSIDLRWDTFSHNCHNDLPRLPRLTYLCSCSPTPYKQINGTVTKLPRGGTCNIYGLDPFTDYNCKVQPIYNKPVDGWVRVEERTLSGIPPPVYEVTATLSEHNVILVTCVNHRVKHFNGLKKQYIARLYDGSNKELDKQTKGKCEFEFKDLSYSNTYTVKVTTFNGVFESEPNRKDITTSYNNKALIGFLVCFIICVALAVVVYKIYVRRRKSTSDVNQHVMFESSVIYATVSQDECIIKPHADEDTNQVIIYSSFVLHGTGTKPI